MIILSANFLVLPFLSTPRILHSLMKLFIDISSPPRFKKITVGAKYFVSNSFAEHI